MGSILSSKVNQDGKVVYEVEVDRDEAIQLKGHLDNVHIFSDNAAEVSARISLRGKNEATQYFLIPRELRKGLKINTAVSCQKLDTPHKLYFVYVVDKLKV